MSDFKTAQHIALEIMRNPPGIGSKLAALDALDRLAMNSSGWLSDAVLQALTDARKALLTDRWQEGLRILEEMRTTMVGFVGVLKAKASEEGGEDHQAAVQRAHDELNQCVQVLAWLDTRPPS